MREPVGVRRRPWLGAAGAVALSLALAVWVFLAAPTWVSVPRLLLALPVFLLAYWQGRRAWLTGAAGALVVLVSGARDVALDGFAPGVLVAVLVGGIVFSSALLGSALGKRRRVTEEPSEETAQPSETTMLLADVLETEQTSLSVTASSGLEETLDTILSDALQLIPYDVVEVTLWDEGRLCCVTQEWQGSRAYTWEPGGIYQLGEGYAGWMARYRRHLLILDIEEYKGARPKTDVGDYPFRSYIGVPLLKQGRFIGTLGMFSIREGAFAVGDLRMMNAVASQVLMALESASLYEETRRRATELASLAAVSATVSESLELNHVLRAIASAVLELVNCQRSAIFVLDESAQVLRLAMTMGLSEEYFEQSQELVLERDGRACAFVTGEPLIVSDVLTDTSPPGCVPVSPREGFRAFADLPLKRANFGIGMLSAMYTEPHTFVPAEVELLAALADQAAMAIENARLYAHTDRELHRQMEALSGMERVSEQINAVLDIKLVLPLVLEEAVRISKATCGGIALKDAASGELRLEVSIRYCEEGNARLRQALQSPESCPLFAEVIRTGRSVESSDLTGQERAHCFEDGANSALVVPIVYAAELAGLIVLESAEKEGFDQSTVGFIEGVSAQAAIAIGNDLRDKEQRRLTESMQRRADQLAMVLEVSRALRSDRPLEEVLEEIAYAIQESVEFDVVLLGVLDGIPLSNHWVAAAGVPIAFFEEAKQSPRPWTGLAEVMSEEFRISQSYYIPAEEQAHWRDRLDVYEYEEAESVEREPGLWHPHDVLLVPLVGAGGDTRGLLSVSRPRNGRVPRQITVGALEVFAAQAALAIENVRMVEELERRADTLSMFNEVSRAATAELELDEVVGTIVDMAPRLMGYDHSFIFLLDAESERYVPWAVHGFERERIQNVSFVAGEGLVGQVVVSRMPQAVNDLAQESGSALVALRDDVGSVMMSPLIAGGGVVGVLCVGYREPHTFSPTEVARLSALADQVAAAVEHARLFDQVSRFSQELEHRVEERTQELAEAMGDLTVERDRVETLYRIASQLSASLDVDHVLNRALKLVSDATETEQAFIFLLDLQTSELVCRAALGTRDEASYVGKAIRFARGEGLAGWVVEHRQGVVIPDTREDERWEQAQDGAREYRSAIGAPLTAGDAVLGALLLFHEQPDSFAEEHLRLVEAAATQVANAINNAELYRLILNQTDSLGRMLRTQEIEASKNQAILEGVADGVMVADEHGEVILFNAAAERILGLERDQALGRSTDEMLGLYGGEAQQWMETVSGWVENPDTYDGHEFLAAQLEIVDRVVSVHLAPVLAGTDYLGAVSVFRDVTAEVEAERAKSEFVSTVSHELRTPMTSIKGYADLLLMGAVGTLTGDQQRFLTIIKSNTDRLTMLVNDLLDISRIESGRLALAPKVVRIGDLIGQVVTTMQGKMEEKDLALHTDVPQVLPEIFADPDRVIQILTNLVANAHHYTEPGGEIRISARAHGDELHISVKDTGVGISDEDQEKLFTRFFRSDNPVVQDAPGTGLGLSIVQSLVGMHGGRVWLESELGVGSTFSFTMPTAEAWRATQAEEEPREQIAGTKKVLIVEDDADIANLIQMHLAGNSREVLIAHRGEEAIELAQAEKPDVITLDVLLPDVDGFGVLEALKSNPVTQEIPVIVVSILHDRDDGLRLGAVDYLTKPIDEERLVRAVRRVLVRRGTVLVVDDDEDNLSVMRDALRAHSFRVRTTTKGTRALRVAREVRPALILLDLRMPDLDGTTVLKQLKEHPATQGIPVIMMTGSTVIDDANRQKVLALGAASFMTKPFSVEGLIDEIETVLWEDGTAAGSVN
jgi:PAS domain S-box-containing protein